MKPICAVHALLLATAANTFGVSVTGRVETLTNPVGGARLTLFTSDLKYFEEERTDAAGRFEFEHVAAGAYRLGVAALRHEYQERTITVSNQVIDVLMTLGPETNAGRWSIVGTTTPELLDGSGSGTLLPSGEAFFCHDTQDPIAFEAVSALQWYPPNSDSGQGCIW